MVALLTAPTHALAVTAALLAEDVEVSLDAVVSHGLALEEGVKVLPFGEEPFAGFVGLGHDVDELIDDHQRLAHFTTNLYIVRVSVLKLYNLAAVC